MEEMTHGLALFWIYQWSLKCKASTVLSQYCLKMNQITESLMVKDPEEILNCAGRTDKNKDPNLS